MSEVLISQQCHRQLFQHTPMFGVVLGCRNEKQYGIMSLSPLSSVTSVTSMEQYLQQDHLDTKMQELKCMLRTGIEIIGYFMNSDELEETFESRSNRFIANKKDLLLLINPLLQRVDAWTSMGACQVRIESNQAIPTVMSQVYVRTQYTATIPMSVIAETSLIKKQDVQERMENILSGLTKDKVCFGFPNAIMVNTAGEKMGMDSEGIVTLENVLKLPEHPSSKASKKKSKSGKIDMNDIWQDDDPSVGKSNTKNLYPTNYLSNFDELGDVVDVCLLQQFGDSSAEFATVPIMSVDTTNTTIQVNFKLVADALLLVGKNDAMSTVVQRLLHEVREQLTELSLVLDSKPAKELMSLCLKSYHFKLPIYHAPVTILQGNQECSLQSYEYRRRLHQLFLLPENRPIFCTRCALVIAPSSSEKILKNVHLGIPDSPVQGGKQYLVDGPYEYYHYMQDNFNDKGWGCAYRSLQTLASWFRLNHFTTVNVPSHREIQEILVKIGDKTRSFIGSSEWIGSVEVGYCLDELAGITSKSLMVNSGHDLADKGRELANHFETQGTPIMMGGGALAFTILGIDYNASTGDIAFLILDPHYTGKEDLSIIQRKAVSMEGYKATPCGWRRATTFVKSSFYNLCMPQRPQQI